MVTTRPRWATLLALAVLAAALPAPAAAQATGTIAGVVADQSGGVIPGATVEATNDGTGQVRHTTTGVNGYYTLPLLLPGRYDVTATLTGSA